MRKKILALSIVIVSGCKDTAVNDNSWARRPLWSTVPGEYAAFVGAYPEGWDKDDPHSMTIVNETTCTMPRASDDRPVAILCGWMVVWINGRPVTFYTAGADDTIRRALIPPFVPEMMRDGKPREFSMLPSGRTANLVVDDKILRVYILYCEQTVLEQIEDELHVVCRTDFEINEPYRPDSRYSHSILRINRQYLSQRDM